MVKDLQKQIDKVKDVKFYDPGFHGTESYHKHMFGLKFTDSVNFFAKEKGAYWLIDVVASYRRAVGNKPFVVCYLIKNKTGDGAKFSMREDSDRPDFVKQAIQFTDLDVNVKMYLDNGVLMFPSDH